MQEFDLRLIQFLLHRMKKKYCYRVSLHSRLHCLSILWKIDQSQYIGNYKNWFDRFWQNEKWILWCFRLNLDGSFYIHCMRMKESIFLTFQMKFTYDLHTIQTFFCSNQWLVEKKKRKVHRSTQASKFQTILICRFSLSEIWKS